MARDDVQSGGSFLSRFRFLRWFLYGVILLFVLTALAPTVAGKLGLKDWIIAKVTEGMPITVTVERLSLGWTSPIVIEAVAVYDSQNELLAEAPRIETEKTLLSLALSRADLGKIRVERPKVEVVFANHTSNIESVLAAWPKADGPAQPGTPIKRKPGSKFSLELVEGSARIRDDDRKLSWSLGDLELRMTHDTLVAPPLTGHATASLTSDSSANKTAPTSIEIKLDGEMAPTIKGKLFAKLRDLPAELAGPFVRRIDPGLESRGQLNAELASNWYLAPDGTPVFLLGGRIDSDQIDAHGGPLGDDRLVLRKAVLPFHIGFNGSQLQIDRADLTCDLGRASAKGKIDFKHSIATSLGQPGTEVSLDINLAELAERIPGTLRLHKDVHLTVGRVTLSGKTLASNNGSLWDGKLTTSDIRGTRSGKPIEWLEPVSLAFKIRQTSKPLPDIEELKCQSKFLRIEGTATSQMMRVQAIADLNQLATPLSQFVDIGDLGLAGRADATVILKRAGTGGIDGNVKLLLDQFQWGPWKEARLILQADGTGTSSNQKYRIEKGSLRVTSGTDVLEAVTREPLVYSDGPQSGFVYAKLDGDLSRWQQRLKHLAAPIANAAAFGQTKAELWVSFYSGKIDVKSLLATTDNLSLKLGPATITDPQLKIQATMMVDRVAGVLDLKDSQIKGEAIVLHTTNLRIDMPRQTMAGKVVASGDLSRLQRWFSAPGPNSWSGSLWGQADLRAGGDGFDIEFQSVIKGLSYGPAGKPLFQDPNLAINAHSRYDGKQGVFLFEKAEVASQRGSIGARGQISKLDTTMNLDVQGMLAYDLSIFEPTLTSYLGAGARVQGKDRREFRLAGPLRPKGKEVEFGSLGGHAGVSWELVKGYGANIGPADIKAQLGGGWIRIDPVVTSINQGRLTLAPSIRLDSTPQELILPAGPVIDGATITPEMCASALGYTLPMLANVAQADGQLSVHLDGGRMPLSDPARGDLRGTLFLHHAKIGPGPLVQELTGLLKIGNPHSVIRDNRIKVKLEQGRVHHDTLELIFADNFTVKTSGSVGLDGTLNMVAEFPIPAKLLGNLRLPTAVARTPVRLPIGGTIERPRIDARALQDILAQAARDAARDAAGNLIEGQLKKLFGPKN